MNREVAAPLNLPFLFHIEMRKERVQLVRSQVAIFEQMQAVVDLPLSEVQGFQLRAQCIDFVEQIQRECNSSSIDFQITR